MIKPSPSSQEQHGPALPMAVIGHEPSVSDKQRPLWVRKGWVIPVAMLLIATGGVIGLYFQPPGLQKVMSALNLEPGAGTSTPIAVRAPAKGESVEATRQTSVAGLGVVLPEGRIITVAVPYGATGARIRALNVSEGDLVARGDVLAVLDNEAQLQARLESARALLNQRQADQAKTRSAIEASAREATAKLARARAAARNANSEHERNLSLRGRGMISDAAIDSSRSRRDQANREVDAARATLSRYASTDIDDQVDVTVAARSVDAALAELNRATQDLEQAYVRAPADGTILNIHARMGEQPGNDGLLSMGDISRMVVDVEVYQSEIGLVSVGAPVTVVADALPTRLSGTVSRIGLEVGRQQLIADDPAANTDARVIKVDVALDDASSAVAARFSNLQVVARIAVGDER